MKFDIFIRTYVNILLQSNYLSIYYYEHFLIRVRFFSFSKIILLLLNIQVKAYKIDFIPTRIYNNNYNNRNVSIY